MYSCETFGNQRVLFSRKQLDNMRAFLVHTLFNFQFFQHTIFIFHRDDIPFRHPLVFDIEIYSSFFTEFSFSRGTTTSHFDIPIN